MDPGTVFMLLTHPRAGGMRRDEQGDGTAQRWRWEGETSKGTQQAPALNILAMGTPVEALRSRVAPLLFYA